MQHFDITVSGRVQGVNFRNATLQKAVELSLNGFVRNEKDGSVYIECEGDEDALHAFIEWCHRGPILAKVAEVQVRKAPVKGFRDFSIERL